MVADPGTEQYEGNEDSGQGVVSRKSRSCSARDGGAADLPGWEQVLAEKQLWLQPIGNEVETLENTKTLKRRTPLGGQ